MSKNDSFDYRLGYVNGFKEAEKIISKNLLEMIDNRFINNLDDLKEGLNKALNTTEPYLF